MICQSTGVNYCHGILAQIHGDDPGIGEQEHTLPVYHLLWVFLSVNICPHIKILHDIFSIL